MKPMGLANWPPKRPKPEKPLSASIHVYVDEKLRKQIERYSNRTNQGLSAGIRELLAKGLDA